MWPMGLLFLKPSRVKPYSYENDFSGVFDVLHKGFLVLMFCGIFKNIYRYINYIKYFVNVSL